MTIFNNFLIYSAFFLSLGLMIFSVLAPSTKGANRRKGGWIIGMTPCICFFMLLVALCQIFPEHYSNIMAKLDAFENSGFFKYLMILTFALAIVAPIILILANKKYNERKLQDFIKTQGFIDKTPENKSILIRSWEEKWKSDFQTYKEGKK